MSKVIENATAHFRNKIGGQMNSIDVPEWDTKIYFKTVSTLKDESRIVELTQQGKTVEALVESIIVRARNEDGSKMFGIADKPALMNEIDPGVIIRVAGEMNNATAADTLEQAEKN
jgi:hypothetical protein